MIKNKECAKCMCDNFDEEWGVNYCVNKCRGTDLRIKPLQAELENLRFLLTFQKETT